MPQIYDLIVFDMDGTLLTSEKTISPTTVAAIREATSRGKRAAIGSGRSHTQVGVYRPQLVEAGVRYVISGNGGTVYDSALDRLIGSTSFPTWQVSTIIAACEGEDVMVNACSDGAVVASGAEVARMPHYLMGAYQELFEDVAICVDDIRGYLLSGTEGIQKIDLHFADIEGRRRVLGRLESLDVEWAFCEEASLELSPAGVSKGSGLLRLCEGVGVAPECTIAVGDDGNDLPMLRAAGLAIAMGNAREDVKAEADFVVRDNDHDGCAEAVLRFLS